MRYKHCQIYSKETGKVIYPSVLVPDSFLSRAKGLLGRKRGLGSDEGMLFPNCNSIHMLAMRFPIDVLFIDSLGEIIRCKNNLKPWRVALEPQANVTLEVQQDSIKKNELKPGMQIGWRFK